MVAPFVLSAAIVAVPSVTSPQGDWKWPERAQNLKVLPEDTSPEKLRSIMFGFTRSLGVRCNHCHVGEPNAPLSTYDFVSDENPKKPVAREMYEMLADINGHLGEIEPYPALARSARRRDLPPHLELRFKKPFADDFLDVPELQGQRPETLPEVVILRARAVAYVLDAANGAERYTLDFRNERDLAMHRYGVYEPKGPLVFAANRLLGVTERRIFVFNATTGAAIAQPELPDGARGERLLEHQGQVFLVFRSADRLGISLLHPDDGSRLWTTLLEPGTVLRGLVRAHVIARQDRLLVFTSTSNPALLTVLDATTGAIESNNPIAPDRPGSTLAVPPVFLPSGRVLVGLVTPRARGYEYVHNYVVVMLDPDGTRDTARLWEYPSPGDENRHLLHLAVVDDWVACVDEARGVTVLDLRTGVRVQQMKMAFSGENGELRYVDTTQPSCDSLLLVLTRSIDDAPAEIYAYEMPDLRRKYPPLALAEADREAAKLVDAQGVIAVAIGPRRGRATEPRIELYDPLTGKPMDGPIVLDARDAKWINAVAQNGFLIVTTDQNEVHVYGPQERPFK
jgi:hypothetical protein